jgi:glycosyltransferase involved in cell wall biosynthesis
VVRLALDIVVSLSLEKVRKPCGTFKMLDGASFGSPLSVVAERLLNGRMKRAVVDSCRSAFVIGAFSLPEHGSRGISEDLCARLASAGWRMRIVSRHPSRIGRVLEMLWTCWRERHRYRVAAVDLYSGPAFFWAKAVCVVLRRIGKPYILMLHGGNLPKFAASRQGMVRSLLASAVAVTTPSNYLMEHMQPYRDDIQVLPNGISIRTYPYKLRRQGALRLIWLRAFHEVYNPEMAVQALALLKQDFPDIHLTMIGPDKGDGSLQRTRQEAERLCVIDHLTLLGSVRKEDVPEKLADGDIFLNTARIDNTPVSVLEAMASGLCVVSTSVGGIPYLVRAEYEALLVPSDNAESMAEAVRRIIIEPDLSRRLSYNARRKAEQLDWSVILPRWEKLLSSAIHSDG